MNGAMSPGVAAVDRALEILGAFKESDEALTLSVLSSRTGLYKSTILRLATSLQAGHYICRLQDGRFTLGPELLRLGNLYHRTLRLSNFIRPAIKHLSIQCDESVSFFGFRKSDMRVCLCRVDSEHMILDHVREGDSLPLDRGSGGKVLLAFSGRRGKLFDQIRARMVFSALGDRDCGIGGVSSPVFGPNSVLLGSLCVVGPIDRLTGNRLRQFEPIVKLTAAQLTKTLGGDPQMFRVGTPTRC